MLRVEAPYIYEGIINSLLFFKVVN